MIIGTKRLLEMVKNSNLIEGLCTRELTNPEGEGLEVRVGEVYKLDKNSKGYLGMDKRSTPKTILVSEYNEKKENQDVVTFYPGDYRLITTIEKVNIPKDISVEVGPRTTLQRSGMILIKSNTSPGYSGNLTFGLYNASQCEFNLELGARIAQLIFHETSENISDYRGQWNGGRVSTQGKSENQV